jgi:hypothetical protein
LERFLQLISEHPAWCGLVFIRIWIKTLVDGDSGGGPRESK